jgi:phospholipid/cholesterol/gamma-HCH transport system substrate-binding protein
MKYSKELKIGVFVISVLVVSFFVINYLRGKDIFNREYDYVAYFEDVQGLAESAPVFIKGYKAGKVVEVVPSGRGFKVVCSVDKRFDIPTDSKMTIYSSDIMGGKAVKIEYGQSTGIADDGATLTPSFEAGMLDAVPALMEKVGNTLDTLTVTVASVNKLLCDENQIRIANTLADLEKTVESVSEIAATVEGRSADIDAFVTDLVELSGKLTLIAEKTSTTIDGVNDAVGVVTEKLTEADIKGVLDSFRSLLNKVNDPDGTIGKLLVDGSVYDSLDSLLIDIDSLVKKIEQNPKKYMKLSIF